MSSYVEILKKKLNKSNLVYIFFLLRKRSLISTEIEESFKNESRSKSLMILGPEIKI